ncbi:MAG: hypothetical protein ACE5F1_00960 [Planctomycetota bacterium]
MPSLFPIGPPPDHPWFKGGTATQKRNVAKGLHPLGFPLLVDSRAGEASAPAKTCGECKHAVKRIYKKCLRHETRGPGTDIRWKWAACENFEEQKHPPPGGEPKPT